jgi:hypothetical protein
VKGRVLTNALAELSDVLDDDEMPNEKRAAVAIIELRTRLEIYKMACKFSFSINTALVGAIVVKLLLN